MSRFRNLWESSELSPDEMHENHSYTIGGEDSPSFPRIEKFDAVEPLRDLDFEGPLPTEENPMPELTERRPDTATRSFCGASLSPRRPEFDGWKEWNRARARLLLGGERVTRTGRGYTVFPACENVNKAILGTANKFIPSAIDKETGLPCEDFRDLCAHLATCIETTAGGQYSTHYLSKHAAAYLRKMGAAQSLSHDQTHNKGRTHD